MSKVLRLRSRAWRPISLAVIGLAAAAAPASATARPGTDVVKDAAKRCAALTGTEVPARQFALPTRGAHVDSGTLTAADAATGRPEFCLVRGSVRGQDPAATPINFEVNLPTAWNRKAVQFGGGGFNGSLVTGLDPVPGSAPVTASAAPPINRGYATFGSDGGTAVGTNPQGSFALNAETLRNYSGESVKRTHDVAAAILQQYYRRSSAYQYYVGGSKGGHEGLVAAQRYGKDYDGIVAYYPANQNQAMVLSWYHLQQAAYALPGGTSTRPSSNCSSTPSTARATDSTVRRIAWWRTCAAAKSRSTCRPCGARTAPTLVTHASWTHRSGRSKPRMLRWSSTSRS